MIMCVHHFRQTCATAHMQLACMCLVPEQVRMRTCSRQHPGLLLAQVRMAAPSVFLRLLHL